MSEEIIDGIDVSECEHINCCDKKIKCVILQDDVCEIDPYCEGYNCYYKQLKRLQAENKELKNIIKVNDSTKYDYSKLMQENEQLKESNLQLQTIDMEIDRNNKYRKENEELKNKNYTLQSGWDFQIKMNEKLNKKLDNLLKLRKALEEIRDNCVEMLATIEEEGKPNKSIVDTVWCKNIPCCTLWDLIENTQRKISEVLDERN